MTGEWKTWREADGFFQVLQHPNGARAYFSEFRIGDMLMRNRGIDPCGRTPFEVLACLIAQGLEPYKVEGDMPELAQTRVLTYGDDL